MKKFVDFIDKKQRESVKHLGIIKDLLERQGMSVSDFTDKKIDPYIFVESPVKGHMLGGVRIYKTGHSIAYRIQKLGDTQPFGEAYKLDIEGMFEDLLEEDETDAKKAAQQVAKAISSELKHFFEETIRAEEEIQNIDLERNRDPLGKVVVNFTGTDYSNTVFDTGTNYGGA